MFCAETVILLYFVCKGLLDTNTTRFFTCIWPSSLLAKNELSYDLLAQTQATQVKLYLNAKYTLIFLDYLQKGVHIAHVSDICVTLTVWLCTLYNMVFRNTVFFYQNWFNTSTAFCVVLCTVPSSAVFSLTLCEKFITLTHKDHKSSMLFINDFSWMKSVILSWPYLLGSGTKCGSSWSWRACLSDSCYQRNLWVLFPVICLKFWNVILFV